MTIKFAIIIDGKPFSEGTGKSIYHVRAALIAEVIKITGIASPGNTSSRTFKWAWKTLRDWSTATRKNITLLLDDTEMPRGKLRIYTSRKRNAETPTIAPADVTGATLSARARLCIIEQAVPLEAIMAKNNITMTAISRFCTTNGLPLPRSGVAG